MPCASASIGAAVDGPATATITLVPTQSSFYAPERTVVHLFWYDDQGVPRRIFEGEVIGKTFAYQAGRRQATYKCRDLTTYWEHAHELFFATYVPTETPLVIERPPSFMDLTSRLYGKTGPIRLRKKKRLLWPNRLPCGQSASGTGKHRQPSDQCLWSSQVDRTRLPVHL